MPKRKAQEPRPLEVRQFTSTEIDRGIAKLRRRIEEVVALETDSIRYDDARRSSTESNIKDTIRDVFGPNSPELNEHQSHRIWHGLVNAFDTEADLQAKFRAGIPQTITMLESLIARLEEKREDAIQDQSAQRTTASIVTQTRRVFVVHGRGWRCISYASFSDGSS